MSETPKRTSFEKLVLVMIAAGIVIALCLHFAGVKTNG